MEAGNSVRINCDCKHDWQDKQYGKGVRIGNAVKNKAKGGQSEEARCTVCKSIRPIKFK